MEPKARSSVFKDKRFDGLKRKPEILFFSADPNVLKERAVLNCLVSQVYDALYHPTYEDSF